MCVSYKYSMALEMQNTFATKCIFTQEPHIQIECTLANTDKLCLCCAHETEEVCRSTAAAWFRDDDYVDDGCSYACTRMHGCLAWHWQSNKLVQKPIQNERTSHATTETTNAGCYNTYLKSTTRRFYLECNIFEHEKWH